MDIKNYDENLCIFYCALSKVEKKFVIFNEPYNLEGETNEEFKNHIERVFAYELYRQWANLLETRHSPLMLNAEIGKDKGKCFTGIREENKSLIYPDLVLHLGQDHDTKHKIVCEIKRDINKKAEDIENDLSKLKDLTAPGALNGNPYECGIMLVYGTSNSEDIFSYYRERAEKIGGGIENAHRVLIVYAQYAPNDAEELPQIKHIRLVDLINKSNS